MCFQPSKFVQSFGVCCKQPLWNVLEITLWGVYMWDLTTSYLLYIIKYIATIFYALFYVYYQVMQIKESCKDGADMQYMLYNVTTNMLKAYLSSHPSSLSAFMVSKTHMVAKKPCRRQLNTRACDIILMTHFQTMITRKRFNYSP